MTEAPPSAKDVDKDLQCYVPVEYSEGAPNRDGSQYYDVDLSWVPETAGLRRVATLCYPAAYRTFCVMEAIGGVIVRSCGLDQSRYQYAVDEYHRRERVKREKEQTRIARNDQKELNKGFGGIDDDDDDCPDAPYVPPVYTERVSVDVTKTGPAIQRDLNDASRGHESAV